MSLPNGYKRLEYIQSSGTQYVDSGFKPSSNTKVVADYYTTSTQGAVIGSDNSWLNSDFVIEVHFAAFSSTIYNHSTVPSGRHTATLDKGVFSLDGETLATMAGTFTGSYNLTLFALNRSNSIQEYGILRLYSCQIYDNGSICRDFIPCQKADGAVGLWDDVNEVFYGNAGSGAFTAGPEVPKAPPTPSGFTSGRLTDTTVKLGWTASNGATGYKLYKNGALLATLTDTSYTDTAQIFSSTVYAVTAYNDDGESTAAELTYCSIPENPILYLVTDRTESDVAYAKLLSGKGMGSMSDEEKAEWLSGLKGSYNASDLNRVGSAVDYVAGRLQRFGNAVEVYTKKDWATKDVPNVSAMKRYLNDVATLRAVLAVLSTTPEVPPDMDGLTYTEANNIEQILKDIDLLITNMTAAWFYSGDLYAGEV